MEDRRLHWVNVSYLGHHVKGAGEGTMYRAPTRILRRRKHLREAVIWFLFCGRCGQRLLRALWRCGGRGIRGCGNRRCRGDDGGVAEESWTANLHTRGDRWRRRA